MKPTYFFYLLIIKNSYQYKFNKTIQFSIYIFYLYSPQIHKICKICFQISKNFVICQWNICEMQYCVHQIVLIMQYIKPYLFDNKMESFKCWFLLWMPDPSAAVKNRNPFHLCLFTHTTIHTVIWPEIPLTAVHVQLICSKQKTSILLVENSSRSYM